MEQILKKILDKFSFNKDIRDEITKDTEFFSDFPENYFECLVNILCATKKDVICEGKKEKVASRMSFWSFFDGINFSSQDFIIFNNSEISGEPTIIASPKTLSNFIKTYCSCDLDTAYYYIDILYKQANNWIEKKPYNSNKFIPQQQDLQKYMNSLALNKKFLYEVSIILRRNKAPKKNKNTDETTNEIERKHNLYDPNKNKIFSVSSPLDFIINFYYFSPITPKINQEILQSCTLCHRVSKARFCSQHSGRKNNSKYKNSYRLLETAYDNLFNDDELNILSIRDSLFRWARKHPHQGEFEKKLINDADSFKSTSDITKWNDESITFMYEAYKLSKSFDHTYSIFPDNLSFNQIAPEAIVKTLISQVFYPELLDIECAKKQKEYYNACYITFSVYNVCNMLVTLGAMQLIKNAAYPHLYPLFKDMENKENKDSKIELSPLEKALIKTKY